MESLSCISSRTTMEMLEMWIENAIKQRWLTFLGASYGRLIYMKYVSTREYYANTVRKNVAFRTETPNYNRFKFARYYSPSVNYSVKY